MSVFLSIGGPAGGTFAHSCASFFHQRKPGSRETYYQILCQYEEGGEETLLPAPRAGVPNLKNRTPKRVESAAVRVALAHPEWGQVVAANVLQQRGYDVSPSGVRRVWIRHGLATAERRAAAARAAEKERRSRRR